MILVVPLATAIFKVQNGQIKQLRSHLLFFALNIVNSVDIYAHTEVKTRFLIVKAAIPLTYLKLLIKILHFTLDNSLNSSKCDCSLVFILQVYQLNPQIKLSSTDVERLINLM